MRSIQRISRYILRSLLQSLHINTTQANESVDRLTFSFYPLQRLQQEEELLCKDKLKIYEEEFRQWKKTKDTETDAPVILNPLREYIVTDATSEAIASIQNNQPNNGFLSSFQNYQFIQPKRLD